jgi:hypothetical protein
MAKVAEIAWLAGLLEGDGSFQLHDNGSKGKKNKCPLIALSMLDLDVVERVSKIFGCNIGKYLTPKKDKYIYTARTGKRSIVEPLILALYPYMGARRKEQINKMFTWYDQHPVKNKKINHE